MRCRVLAIISRLERWAVDAWALLFDVTDEPTVADDWCADLAEDVLRWLAVEGFALPESDLVDWLHLPLRPRCAEVPARR